MAKRSRAIGKRCRQSVKVLGAHRPDTLQSLNNLTGGSGHVSRHRQKLCPFASAAVAKATVGATTTTEVTSPAMSARPIIADGTRRGRRDQASGVRRCRCRVAALIALTTSRSASRCASLVDSGSHRATVPHGCNPLGTVEFDCERLGCSEQWMSIMMRKIAIGLATVTIALAGSTLMAPALPGGGSLGVAQSVGNGDNIDKVTFRRGGFRRGVAVGRGVAFRRGFAVRRGFGRAYGFRPGFRRGVVVRRGFRRGSW